MSALIRALVPAGGQKQAGQGGVMSALFGQNRQQQQVQGPASEAPPDVGSGGEPQDYLKDNQRTSKSQNPVANLFKPQLMLRNE